MCPECQSTAPLRVEEPEIYDGTLYHICADCGHAWAPNHHIDYRQKWANRFVATHNRGRGTCVNCEAG